MSVGLNLAEYANSAANGGNGQAAIFGGSSAEELNQLNKALEAGSITGRDTANLSTASGAPLKVESLDKTLKHITFKESEIVLWKNIPKKSAYNTVEEFNQLVDFGTNRGGFYNEGELPNEEDSTYVRRAQLVKFMGVVKSVTHPMTLVNNMVGNMVEKEIKNGTMWILRKLNQSLYFGDEALVPQEFNGFLAQHQRNDAWVNLDAYYNSEVVIDLHGSPLTEEAIETASNGIVENFGLGNQLYAPPKVLSDFVKGFYGNKFIQPNSDMTANGIMGQKVQAFDSQFGRIGLNWDVFFKKLPTKTSLSGASSPTAPLVVTSNAITAVAPVDPSSNWEATDAGTYFYAVTAINRYGESAPVQIGAAAVTVLADGSVDLDFTDGGGANPATSYRVYRSNAGAASYAAAILYPLYDVSVAEKTAGYDGGAATIVRDRNRSMPNTDQAMLLQQDNEVVEFAQLAPLMKMDLAILSPAYRFMILLYGTPFLYAPKKMVRFVNIGQA
jgi:hypothetical protein